MHRRYIVIIIIMILILILIINPISVHQHYHHHMICYSIHLHQHHLITTIMLMVILVHITTASANDIEQLKHRTAVLENVTLEQEKGIYEKGMNLRQYVAVQAEKDAELKRLAIDIQSSNKQTLIQQQQQHEEEMRRLQDELNNLKYGNVNAQQPDADNNPTKLQTNHPSSSSIPPTQPQPSFTYGLPISSTLASALQRVAAIRSPASALYSTSYGHEYGSPYPLHYPYYPIVDVATRSQTKIKAWK